METRQLSMAAATVGTVAASGPAGLGRPDTISYLPAGFDPVFDAWTFAANGNNLSGSLTTPAPYKLHNPLFILRGYNLATEPSQVKVNGILLTGDRDYYASAVPSRNELWLTLRGQYQGTTSVEVIASAAVVSYSVTATAGANGAISPTGVQTIASGATAAYTVTPLAGYTAIISGSCGGSLDRPTGVYTTVAIVANCSVTATFLQAVSATTAIGSSLSVTKAGQAVTLTASVTGNSGVPTGNVTFRDGISAIIGCVSVPLSAGSAQCLTTALSPGMRAITATYFGNGVYGTSTSSIFVQTVTPGGIVPITYFLLD